MNKPDTSFIGRIVEGRVLVCAVVLALYLGCAMVFGRQLDADSGVVWNLATLGWVLVVSIFVLPFALFGFSYISNQGRKTNGRLAAKNKPVNQLSTKTSVVSDEIGLKYRLIALIALAIPQVVVFLTVLPGVYEYDSAFHILQFTDAATPITSQYSVIYTVFVGACVELGRYFGSVFAGLALAMFGQAAISIAIIYYVIIDLWKLTKSRVVFYVSLCVCALHPFTVLMRVSACQDVLFGAFFMLTAMQLLRLGYFVSEKKGLLPKDLVLLAAASVAMMLMRNNGSYALIVMIAFSLPFIIIRKAWKVIVGLAVSLACFWVISGPIYTLCGVQSSSATLREMSSIPSQQLARALVEHPDRFTSEELDIYMHAYDVEMYGFAADDVSWYWSQSEISDLAKARINQEYVKGHLLDYASLYFGVGSKCIGSYINAFLMNTLGYWYPCKSYPDARMYHPLIQYEDAQSVPNDDLKDNPRQSLFPALNSLLSAAILGGSWSRIPVLSLLFKPGFYMAIFIFLAMTSFILRRSDQVLVLGFCAGLIVTLILSPVCLFRYFYPLLLTIPLLFSGAVPVNKL